MKWLAATSAAGTPDRLAAAETYFFNRIVQWLSFAANEINHSLCTARLVQKFGYALDKEAALGKSPAVLSLLDQHLERNDWLAMGRPTIADCAVYPYVALAPEGSVDLAPYSHVFRWMKRMEQLPGWQAVDAVMPESA